MKTWLRALWENFEPGDYFGYIMFLVGIWFAVLRGLIWWWG